MGLGSSIKKAVSKVSKSVSSAFGGGSLGSSLITGGLSLLGGSLANASAEQIASDNRDFQANLSGNAIQRQVNDLRMAGINPVLAARYGGASTPSGAVAGQQDVITPAIASAMQVKQAESHIEKQDKEKALLSQQESNAKQVGNNLKQQENQIIAQTQDNLASAYEKATRGDLNNEQILNTALSRERLGQEVKKMEILLKGLKTEGEIDDSTYGKVIRWLGRLNPFTPNVSVGAFKKFK